MASETAKEICREKCRALNATPCVDHPRNTRKARSDMGLNPTFNGCPACVKEAKQRNES